MRQINGVTALVAILVLPMQAFAQGNPQSGQEIAERWCSSCHLVTPEQAQASAGVPSFMIIARRSSHELDWLIAFLADPHPPMPNLSLTRQEIKDLVAYFEVLQKKKK